MALTSTHSPKTNIQSQLTIATDLGLRIEILTAMKCKKTKWMLLPAPKGTCQKCAVAHAEDQPHNQQSLFWQYWFFGQHERWPTWKDAMEHCSDETKRQWTEQLAKHGITV